MRAARLLLLVLLVRHVVWRGAAMHASRGAVALLLLLGASWHAWEAWGRHAGLLGA